jgi:hypothetical protein
MEYELTYVARRAAEERLSAKAATSAAASDSHLFLARAFEDHSCRIQRSGSVEAEIVAALGRKDD